MDVTVVTVLLSWIKSCNGEMRARGEFGAMSLDVSGTFLSSADDDVNDGVVVVDDEDDDGRLGE